MRNYPLCQDCGKRTNNYRAKRCQKCYFKNILGTKEHPFYGKKHKQLSKDKMKITLALTSPVKILGSSGYILIWDSRNILKRKRVLEHRYIIEQIIKRKLKKNEVVHHINENKKDNRPQNLYLFKTRYAHNLYTKLHILQPEIMLKSNLKDVK